VLRDAHMITHAAEKRSINVTARAQASGGRKREARDVYGTSAICRYIVVGTALLIVRTAGALRMPRHARYAQPRALPAAYAAQRRYERMKRPLTLGVTCFCAALMLRC